MISQRELTRYRGRYIEQLLQEEHGEFSELDRQVAESIAKQDTIAENTEEEFEEHRTLGDRASDRLASFGGSWYFLISFGLVLVAWMALNIAIGSHAYDPYPFILLNLCLSCVAAVQAPIIMMSQKRQESKDRLRADNDYRVNLKAELEIRHLHEKLDYLISRQWQRLAEIQQMQIDVMQEQRGPVRRPARRSPRARATPKLEPGSEPSGNAGVRRLPCGYLCLSRRHRRPQREVLVRREPGAIRGRLCRAGQGVCRGDGTAPQGIVADGRVRRQGQWLDRPDQSRHPFFEEQAALQDASGAVVLAWRAQGLGSAGILSASRAGDGLFLGAGMHGPSRARCWRVFGNR